VLHQLIDWRLVVGNGSLLGHVAGHGPEGPVRRIGPPGIPARNSLRIVRGRLHGVQCIVRPDEKGLDAILRFNDVSAHLSLRLLAEKSVAADENETDDEKGKDGTRGQVAR